jgi:hypothetical protein
MPERTLTPQDLVTMGTLGYTLTMRVHPEGGHIEASLQGPTHG